MSPMSLLARDQNGPIDSAVGYAAIPQNARIGYLVTAMIGTAVTASLFTYRVKSLNRSLRLRHMKPLHYMQFTIYLLGILFSLSAALITFGFGLDGPSECQGAIILCVVFYLGQKFLLYLFLVERTQVVRARLTPRHKNVIYLACLFLVVLGFTVVAVIAFMWMKYDFNSVTGECFIGLPTSVALPLLTYDITINLLLTGVFLYYIKPYLQGGLISFFVDRTNANQPQSGQNGAAVALPQQKLKRIIRKTFWGCILIMPSTIANLSVLSIMKGHQAGWMCLMFCTLDVLWCTTVIHWLTAPEDDESTLPSSAGANASSQPRSKLRSFRPQHSAIASYVQPRESDQSEMDPFAIRREIEIVQNVESVELDDVINSKDSTSVSMHDLGVSPKESP